MSEASRRPPFWRRPASPAVLAWLLAPAVAELLTGAKPPAQFLHPMGLLVVTTLYGCGVLIAHDLSVVWRRGWPALLWLGAAFGLVMEGAVTRSLFTADWPEYGVFQMYGRNGEVNWGWGVQALIFHAVVSVAVPVLLVELLRPEARGERWLTGRGLRRVQGLFAVVVVLAALPGLDGGRPGPLLLVLLVAAWMVNRARTYRRRPVRGLPPGRPWRVALSTSLLTLAFLAFTLFAPAIPPAIVWPSWVLLGLLVVTGLVARRFARRVAGGWTERHRLAAVTGVVGTYALLALVQEGAKDRAENPMGMALVGLLALYGLWRLRRRVHAREAAGASAAHAEQPPA